MNRLLSVNFMRLRKSRLFWGGVLFMAALAVMVVLNTYFDQREYGGSVCVDGVLGGFALFSGIVCAVFGSLFLGTEYKDGTIRNKLSVGHSRFAVYLSNLLVMYVGSILLCAAYLLPCCALGIPLLGGFQTDGWTLLLWGAGNLFMLLAVSGILTCMGMLISSKDAAAAAAILGAFIMLMCSVYIYSRLSEPEYYEGQTYVDEAGEIITEPPARNINYVEGTEREVYELLNRFLPTGQALHYQSVDGEGVAVQMGYALIIFAGSTGIGVWCFKKKDIK